jgi:hypothetical protein
MHPPRRKRDGARRRPSPSEVPNAPQDPAATARFLDSLGTGMGSVTWPNSGDEEKGEEERE